MAVYCDNWKAEVSTVLTEEFLSGAIHRWNAAATEVVDYPTALWTGACPPLREAHLLVGRLHRVLLVAAVSCHEEHLASHVSDRAGCSWLVYGAAVHNFARRGAIITIEWTLSWPHNPLLFHPNKLLLTCGLRTITATITLLTSSA